jgi:hypothetical protein
MNEEIRSADELVKRAAIEPGVIEEIKADPLPVLQRLSAEVTKDIPPRPPLESDPLVYRIVVLSLGLVIVLSVIGAVVLGMSGRTIPETLTALGSGSVGALTGLLIPTPGRR